MLGVQRSEKAKRALQHFMLSGENLQPAMERLIKLFGMPDTMHEIILDKLRKVPAVQDMRKAHDTINEMQTLVHQLQNMGYEIRTPEVSQLLVPLILSKLPTSMVARWHRYKKYLLPQRLPGPYDPMKLSFIWTRDVHALSVLSYFEDHCIEWEQASISTGNKNFSSGLPKGASSSNQPRRPKQRNSDQVKTAGSHPAKDQRPRRSFRSSSRRSTSRPPSSSKNSYRNFKGKSDKRRASSKGRSKSRHSMNTVVAQAQPMTGNVTFDRGNRKPNRGERRFPPSNASRPSTGFQTRGGFQPSRPSRGGSRGRGKGRPARRSIDPRDANYVFSKRKPPPSAIDDSRRQRQEAESKGIRAENHSVNIIQAGLTSSTFLRGKKLPKGKGKKPKDLPDERTIFHDQGCIFCGQDHPSAACINTPPVQNQAETKQRWAKVFRRAHQLGQQLCFCCLNPVHNEGENALCPGKRCSVRGRDNRPCNRHHHESLHLSAL